MLLGKEEVILLGMTDRLTERGRCSAMEVNLEKTKTKRISTQPSPKQSMIKKKNLENVEYVNILGRMMTKYVQVNLNLGLSW